MQKRRYTAKNNPIVASLIRDLRKASAANEAPIWRRISQIIKQPSRHKTVVNLSKIERYVKDDEVAVVPGKVLAVGEMTRPLTVAAVSFSKAAENKIVAVKGRAITILDLVNENPRGSKVRIIR